MEKRLEKRFNLLVRSHMQNNSTLAAGVKTLLDKDAAFNQTQAAWRFFNNDRCTLEELSAPLLKAAHEFNVKECELYGLIAHDWSHLSYDSHQAKKDKYIRNKHAGYELQSSLLLSDSHGGPLSLVAMNLKDKKINHSSYSKHPRSMTHLEELAERIHWLEKQHFDKSLVHIIDREADSVGFLRAIHPHKWLIRANGRYNVEHENAIKKIQDVVKELVFKEERQISFKGKTAIQQIAETNIMIVRPAKLRKFHANGQRMPVIEGQPISCRLIVSRIVDQQNKELALWYLLCNVDDAKASQVALWYYWRWSIESYFKLMKTAGMQLESWQQTTSISIARRILVASMACVFVWRIANAKGAQAEKVRKILVRLSGRQMKWKKEFTYPALLAGLWTLLSMQNILEHHKLGEIKSLLTSIFGEKGLFV